MNVREVLVGFVFALLMVGLAVIGVRAQSWKHWVEAEAWHLHEPVVTLPDGRTLDRAQLLDILIRERLHPPTPGTP